MNSVQTAPDFGAFSSAWSDFLSAHHRAYMKLQTGAKRKGHSKDWFEKRADERRNDPLLSYLHHARNVDEHGLAKIAQLEPWQVGLGPGSSNAKVERTPDGGTAIGPIEPGGWMFISHMIVQSPHAKLQTVTDRGVTYSVPTSHLGNPLPDTSPATIMTLAITHLQTMLDDASKQA